MQGFRRRLPLANPGVQLSLFDAPGAPQPDEIDRSAEPEGPLYVEEPGPSCVRSPCVSMKEAWDPKLSQEDIKAARLEVGKPKLRRGIVELALEPTGAVYKSGAKKGQPKMRPLPVWQDTADYYRPGEPFWPLAVSYGIGIDSTAILVGLVQIVRELEAAGRHEDAARFRPRWITFADTGAEKASTYAYLRLLNAWLVENGLPTVTTVAWAQFGGSQSWGSHRTLEQKCLNNHTMPSISASKFKRSECSVTWKHDPQDRWFQHYSGAFEPVRSHNCSSLALESVVRMMRNVSEVAARSSCSTGTARNVLKALVERGLVSALSGRPTEYLATPQGEDVAAAGSLMDVKLALPAGLKIIKAIGYDATEEERLDPNALGSTFRAGDGDDPDQHDYAYWYPLMEWGWDRSRCYAEIEAELGPTWQRLADSGELDPALIPGPVPGKSSCFMCGAMHPEEIRYLSPEDLKRALVLELVALRGRHPSTVKGLAVNWSWWDYANGRATKGMPERARAQVEQYGPLLSAAELAEVEAMAEAWLAASPSAKGTIDMAEVGLGMGIPAFTRMRGLRGDPDQLGWDLYQEKAAKANPPLPYDPLLEGSG